MVKPGIAVSTKEAYADIKPDIPDTPLPILLKMPIEEWQGQIKNDFETSVFPKYPEIARIKRKMLDLGAVYASMSGSGSCVFGIFTGDNISELMTENFNGCDIFVSKLM